MNRMIRRSMIAVLFAVSCGGSAYARLAGSGPREDKMIQELTALLMTRRVDVAAVQAEVAGLVVRRSGEVHKDGLWWGTARRALTVRGETVLLYWDLIAESRLLWSQRSAAEKRLRFTTQVFEAFSGAERSNEAKEALRMAEENDSDLLQSTNRVEAKIEVLTIHMLETGLATINDDGGLHLAVEPGVDYEVVKE